MFTWINIRVPSESPSYMFNGPIRHFLLGSIIFVLFSSYPLYRLCKRNSQHANITTSTGLFLTLIGFVGIILILPLFGTMSYSGGLTPDYGHTLTKENLTGSLWLFCIFSGAILHLIGYRAGNRIDRVATDKLLPFVTGVSTYYAGVAIFDFISRMVYSGGLWGKFLFSLSLALIVFFGVSIYLRKSEK